MTVNSSASNKVTSPGHETADAEHLVLKLSSGYNIGIRHDTSGDKFLMLIEGQEIRDRGIAGEVLLRGGREAGGVRGTDELCEILGLR